jgi:UDP-glucose 4-epimerase
VLREQGREVVGMDVLPSPYTAVTGSVAARAALAGVTGVLHAATLPKPHVGSHTWQAFVDINITGTLVLLEEAIRAGVGSFVFTSTTSTFGRALTSPPGTPAAWITEDVQPVPRNIYGVTKTAPEDLCQLAAADHGLPVVVLRMARFFPEGDDSSDVRAAYPDANVKANEFRYRRVDLADAVDAALLALARTPELGFGKYIISATTPFTRADLAALGTGAPAVVWRLFPGARAEYARRGWTMFPRIDRVYVNERARAALGWQPATASGPCSATSPRAAIRAARWRWAPRAATRRPPAPAPCADARHRHRPDDRTAPGT